MEKAVAIDHPEAAAGFFRRQAFRDQGGAEVIGDSGACGTSAEKNDFLIPERRAGHANGREDRSQGNGGSTLNVVIEGEHLIAVAIENRPRVHAGEVFPLEKRGGQNLPDGPHEGVDEAVVVSAGDARVTPAEIFRVAETFLVVGAHVQNDGQSARRMNSADEGVERKLADGNAEASYALVADTENALTIGDDDHINFGIGVIAEERRNETAERIRNEEAAWTPIDVTELLAAERDDRGVNDGQHLVDMSEEQPIEEDFIVVLKLAEIDVAFAVMRLERKSLIGSDALVVQGFDNRRKKTVEAETLTLVFGEGRAFVQRRIVEQIHAAKANGADDVGLRDVSRRHCLKIVSLSCQGQVPRLPSAEQPEALELDKAGSSLLNAVESLRRKEREISHGRAGTGP